MSIKWRLITALFVILILWKAFSYYGLFRSESPIKQNTVVLPQLDGTGPSVRVTVYYEALCSDSRNFILTQLLPTFEILGRYIILELVPYGKATTIEEDGKITFQCQHGAPECLANKIHACVLDKITNSFLRVKFIACMITDNIIPEEAGERCSKEMGFEYKPISDCATSDYGSKLLKAYGVLTHSVIPKITFIPTVEVNGSQKIPLAHLLKDLKGELCKVLPSSTAECQP